MKKFGYFILLSVMFSQTALGNFEDSTEELSIAEEDSSHLATPTPNESKETLLQLLDQALTEGAAFMASLEGSSENKVNSSLVESYMKVFDISQQMTQLAGVSYFTLEHDNAWKTILEIAEEHILTEGFLSDLEIVEYMRSLRLLSFKELMYKDLLKDYRDDYLSKLSSPQEAAETVSDEQTIYGNVDNEEEGNNKIKESPILLETELLS